MELERVGLRNCSLPFDWIISGDFQSVLKLIGNGFSGFTDKENLYQEYEIRPAYFYNNACNVHFYHDFSPYKTFDIQYSSFCEKYLRRIKRFYKVIEEPTIFIRFCSNRKELDFVIENQSKIQAFLKKFHPLNEILYITDIEGDFPIEQLYSVKKDSSDGTPVKFLDQFPQLKDFLTEKSSLSTKIQKNIRRYRINRFKKLINKIIRKLINTGCKLLHIQAYHHAQQYGSIDTENYEH